MPRLRATWLIRLLQNSSKRTTSCLNSFVNVRWSFDMLPLTFCEVVYSNFPTPQNCGQVNMSYRSHVEAYIVCEPKGEDPLCRRQRLVTTYQQRRKAIQGRLTWVLGLIQQTPEDGTMARSYSHSLSAALAARKPGMSLVSTTRVADLLHTYAV